MVAEDREFAMCSSDDSDAELTALLILNRRRKRKIFKSKSAESGKKMKSLDPVDRAILETLSNEQTRPNLRHIQRWGLWLAKEIEEFPEKADRLQIQAHITSYLANKKSELCERRNE